MSLLDALRYRMRVFRNPRSYERDLNDEFAFHLSLEAMQQEHAGRGALSARDVRANARRRFGNPTYHKEESRNMSGLGFIDAASQDLRFAVRTLRRTPGFTIVAIATLALGIGANTAIFSAVDAMILRPLPYAAPDRLMQIAVTVPAINGARARGDAPWSYMKAKVFKEGQHVFSSVALYSAETVTLRDAEATRESAEVIDDEYLPTLGVQPSLGRNFVVEENRPNGKRAVLISAGFWERHFNADSAVLGRTLDIEDEPYTVIGIVPPGFRGLTGHADLWMSIGARRPFLFNPAEAWDHEFSMIGRLGPGIGVERAKTEVAVVGVRANEAFATPGPFSKGWGASGRLLDDARVDPVVRRSLLVLLGASLFVLLIGCANLANLFLIRTSARQREIAVRLAIGASRRRLVRQLLTESALLAVIGGAASLVVAWAGIRVLSALNPERAFSAQLLGGLGAVNFSTIHLDARVFVFALAAAIATGVLFGLIPAVQATRPSLTSALKEGPAESAGRSGILRRLTTRNVLVVLELALALVLLAGSGVMVRSLGKLLDVSPGFDAAGVLTMRLNFPLGPRARDSLPAFYQTLIEQLGAIPGVTSAALGDCPPLAGGCNKTMIQLHDRPSVTPGMDPVVGVHWITPDWLRALRVPLRAGRAFTASDRMGGRKVVLVNASAARRFWPNESPIGKEVGLGQGNFDTAYVAGVVGDVHFDTIDSLAAPDVYLPYLQSPRSGALVYLRTSGDPAALTAAARRTIHEVGAEMPIYDVRTLASRVSDATAQSRFSALLLLLFAFAALALATLGIYGVIAYAVAQRTREIGIRVALGADRGSVLRLVVSQGAALAIVGIAFGTAAALVTTRVLSSLLYDVAPADPLTFVTVIALLAFSALAASFIPARRAAALQPSIALRD